MSVTPENEFQKRRAAREAQKGDGIELEGVAHVESRDDGFDLLLAFSVTAKGMFSRIHIDLTYKNPVPLQPEFRKREMTLSDTKGLRLDKSETSGDAHAPPVCDLDTGVVYFEMEEYAEILEKVLLESAKQAAAKGFGPAANENCAAKETSEDEIDAALDKALCIPTRYLTDSGHIRLVLDAVNSGPMPA